MRSIRVKQIRSQVLIAMYGPDLTDAQTDSVLRDKKFKKVFRAAKKNFNKKLRVQHPKLKMSRRQQRLHATTIN